MEHTSRRAVGRGGVTVLKREAISPLFFKTPLLGLVTKEPWQDLEMPCSYFATGSYRHFRAAGLHKG